MNIYFDTEFTELSKHGELISIGLVDEDDNEFYAEFRLNNIDNVNDFVKENVLTNTVLYGNKDAVDIIGDEKNYVYGSKSDIKDALVKWLSKYENVKLVSDVGHYDMVLFIDIFGTAFDLPENVCPTYYDINQDIAQLYDISIKEAFDVSREDMMESFNRYVMGEKHNSLYDAKVIKALYEEMDALKNLLK